MTKPRVIYWFRTDLRLHDSPALKAALDLNPECLWPVWTWDVHYVRRARVGPNRFQFLIDCQKDLSASITKLNPKSKLFLLREPPQTLFPKLFKAWNVSHLVFEKDVDGYGRQRDNEIMKLAREAGVEVVVRSGRTLWDSDRLVEENGGKPTMSITQVEHAGKKIGDVAKPIPAPKSLPDPGDTPLEFDHEQPAEQPDFMQEARQDKENSYASLAGPNNDFAVPTLEELGLAPASTPHKGGETEGLRILERVIADKDYTATFEKPKTAPTDFDPRATTLMSPHMHFGSVSCREFWWRVVEVVDNYKGTASQPPTSLTGQLMFRDMYFGAQAALGYKFAQTYGNPTIRFIPWHLPSRIDPTNKLVTGSYDIDSTTAHAWFQRWKYGRTGFPWIDALMRQLRLEGWIHHLGRHAVACFLTRGGCYIDWERGAEVFEEWLIDHETACNSGNWQWLSCTAFYSQFYRCYSPIAFPAKWDKDGAFVRHYVPELRHYDRKYIYEPWKAPIPDQKRWRCMIRGDGGADAGTLAEGPPAAADGDGNQPGPGKPKDTAGNGDDDDDDDELPTYPKPMFDFARRRETCIRAMKNAYHVGLHGNDAAVLDGSWRGMFEDSAEGPTEGSAGPPGGMLADGHGDGGGSALGRGGEGSGAGHVQEAKGPGTTKHRRGESNGQTKLDAHVKRSKR